MCASCTGRLSDRHDSVTLAWSEFHCCRCCWSSGANSGREESASIYGSTITSEEEIVFSSLRTVSSEQTHSKREASRHEQQVSRQAEKAPKWSTVASEELAG